MPLKSIASRIAGFNSSDACRSLPMTRHLGLEFIQPIVRRAAESLGTSFDVYWPADENGKNDPEEKNLSFHLAHVLLTDGFFVYAEANHPSHRGLDLLAISSDRDFFVACECKRHLTSRSMTASLQDLRRVMSFRLNDRLRIGRVGPKTMETLQLCRQGVGLVAGLNWMTGSRIRRNGNSASHRNFAQQVELLGGVVGKPEFVRCWDCAEVCGSYFLQYALFPLQIEQ